MQKNHNQANTVQGKTVILLTNKKTFATNSTIALMVNSTWSSALTGWFTTKTQEFVPGLTKQKGKDAPQKVITCFKLILILSKPALINLSDVFQFDCPKVNESIAGTHPRYADPEDCQFFYVCINGDTPRRNGCKLGQVFDDVSKKCEWARNVPEW